MYYDTFGYIMKLRPDNYYDFSDFLIGKIDFSSVHTLLNAAINIVESFRILHNRGFSYQDLNDGNFFLNPETGDVLICDNDNVSQFGEKSGIAGKCRYMAPSIVVGRKTPDKRTDQFSLAVVLFLLLLRNHPLEGEQTQSKAVMTEQRQKRYYGESPVFIADPKNASNRPVKGVHNNFLMRWPQMPVYIQNTFIKAFSKEVMCEEKKPDIPLKMQRVCAVISQSRTLAGSRHNISAFRFSPSRRLLQPTSQIATTKTNAGQLQQRSYRIKPKPKLHS